MIMYPMRNGIRTIVVQHNPDTLRAKCADSAERLWCVYGWTANGLRHYTVNGIIKAVEYQAGV